MKMFLRHILNGSCLRLSRIVFILGVRPVGCWYIFTTLINSGSFLLHVEIEKIKAKQQHDGFSDSYLKDCVCLSAGLQSTESTEDLDFASRCLCIAAALDLSLR